ncbi:O-succinylbenzoic acid--CoA ligase [Agromyces bauzanensis]|uniref:O-succinylbenzoic acid--CoA ligase n=1 Tax=Agromyces bauzanensis TaxID=1308924 RepID=A0A917PNZ0_9MICO|nr:O-succinylbenzoic acid--CoA ligase [Agromyces bauzanensis]
MTAALRVALDGGPAVWPVASRPPMYPFPRSVAGGTGESRGNGNLGRASGGASGIGVDDDVALVVETSGSTDAPKRVLLSADALGASAAATEAALDGPGQWLLALPAHYIAGAQVLARSIVAGTEPVLLGGEHFDPAAFAAASARLDRRRPRYTSLVPVQLGRLVDAAASDRRVAEALRSFDRILLGGQAAPPSLIVAADVLGARVTRTYGSSETSGGCVYDGRPIDGVRARIAEGLVELAGPMLADGYLGDPERTAAAFAADADGTHWYRTGDLGRIEHDGTLRILGRADDVIVSGGVKVALGEVERAVRSQPGFADAVVVRVPDPEWGERPAVVATGTDAAATSDALATLARATDAAGLTPAARPVRLDVVDRMPLLASGKPDRRAIERLVRGGPVA